MAKKNKVPSQIVTLIKQGRYVLSQKARTQADTGWYTTFDLEQSILEGQVIKKEKDEKGDTKYKYTIEGPALSDEKIYSCGKIVKRETQFYFVLTFHELR